MSRIKRVVRTFVTALAATALAFGIGATSAASVAEADTIYRAKHAVFARSGPSTSKRVVTVVHVGQKVRSTGSKNGWVKVKLKGRTLWVYKSFLSKVKTTKSKPAKKKPARVKTTKKPTKSTTSKTTNNTKPKATKNRTKKPSRTSVRKLTVPRNLGSRSLNRLKYKAKRIVVTTRAKWPRIHRIGGWRGGSAFSSDHPAGRAVDVMIPKWRKNSSLGWAIANYYRKNAKRYGIRYIIYRQRIWTTYSRKWRKMSDRGGATANHYDHVHISVKR